MKKMLILTVVTVLISLSFLAYADEKVHYYSCGKTIELTESSSEILVVTKKTDIKSLIQTKDLDIANYKIVNKHKNMGKISSSPEKLQLLRKV